MNPPQRKSLLASAMALLGFGCKGESTPVNPEAGQPSGSVSKSVTVDDILKQDRPLLIDVRTPGEYARGHVPGSVNVPLNQIQEAASVLPSKDTPAIIFCAVGGRASRAIKALQKQGYTGLVNGGGFKDVARKMGVKLSQ
ncbi:MAG: rhodanese-like domain-containing protein [Bradymonadia bacterium]